MPGSITSSTIASYCVAPAIHSASSPLTATSASIPSSRRPRRIRLGELDLVLDDQHAHGRLTAISSGHATIAGMNKLKKTLIIIAGLAALALGGAALAGASPNDVTGGDNLTGNTL